MTDVFVSYASEDRASAQRLALGLADAGLSVWWDRDIQVGSEWDKTIEEALGTAKCVVILWTAHAKQSRWVRAEARAALKQEKIVPIMLESNAIPLAFTGIQALRFLGWNGQTVSKEFDILLKVIKSKLAGHTVALPAGESTKASVVGKVVSMIGVKTIAVVVLTILLVASSFWPVDADLAIQVQTGRIEFVVNPGSAHKRLTDQVLFNTLSLQHVAQLSLSPDRLLVANPEELDWETDTYPPKAWLELSSHEKTWKFQAESSTIGPIVTLESLEPQETPTGKLDAVILSQPATVTLEITLNGAIMLSIRADHSPQRVVLSGINNVELVEEGLRVAPMNPLPFSQDQELTYQAFFDRSPGMMIVEGIPKNFVAVIDLARSTDQMLFSQTVLPLDSVDVSWQDPQTGERTISQNFEGKVRYPNLPDLPEVKLQAPMSLTIEDLEGFEITGIGVKPNTHTFLVDMQGKAGYIKAGTRNNPQDLRPTMFDVIRYHPVLKPLRNLLGL